MTRARQIANCLSHARRGHEFPERGRSLKDVGEARRSRAWAPVDANDLKSRGQSRRTSSAAVLAVCGSHDTNPQRGRSSAVGGSPAPFYDPATRTFRPLCRQAILTVAAGPLAAFMVALAWGMFQ